MVMEEDEGDSYIEELRKKYLHSKSPDASPLPELTESEQNHYDKAMQDLKDLLIKDQCSEGKDPHSGDIFYSKTDIIDISGKELQESADEFSNNEDSETLRDSENTVAQSASLPTMSSDFTINVDAQASLEKPRKSVRISVEPKSITSSYMSNGLEETWPSHGILRNSTIRKSLEPTDVKVIHAELMNIHRKLMQKSQSLAEQQMAINAQTHEVSERETAVAEQEDLLAINIKRVQKAQDVMVRLQGMEAEVEEKMKALHEHHSEEVGELTSALNEKMKEVRRLKNSFEVIKSQNEELKSQNSELSNQSRKLLVQNSKLKKRLENLQRKFEYSEQKKNSVLVPADLQLKKGKQDDQPPASQGHKTTDHVPKMWCNSLETLSVVLEWVCEFHLKSFGNNRVDGKTNDQLFGKEYIVDKCLKVLPLLVEVIRYLPLNTTQSKHHLPYLRFVHWSLHHLEDSHHALLSSTARRIGEELLRPSLMRSGMEQNLSVSRNASVLQHSVPPAEQRLVFFKSPNPEVRLLSSFIILRTLHQVDMLAQIFEQLKKDLKEDLNRKLFLDYAAIQTIVPYMTYKSNKALLSSAVDVMLQMAMESELLPSFLESCSCERYFKAFSSALRAIIQSSDMVTLEKLSIILQKLSKIKSNRKYFDSFSIGRALQERYRECDPESTFLSLNLRSILFNLNLVKTQ